MAVLSIFIVGPMLTLSHSPIIDGVLLLHATTPKIPMNTINRISTSYKKLPTGFAISLFFQHVEWEGQAVYPQVRV